MGGKSFKWEHGKIQALSGAGKESGVAVFSSLQENLLPLSLQASSPAYSGSNIYSPDSSTNSGPIISDVTELAQSSPSASPSGSLDER